MIPPDTEIFEVESRIALRRAQMKRHGHEAGTRMLQALTSPVALAAAAALGFFAAGAVARRRQTPPHPERRKSDHLKAAKATGIAGLLMPVAMWLVRAQWGSPVHAAQALLEKISRRRAGASPQADRRSSLRDMTGP